MNPVVQILDPAIEVVDSYRLSHYIACQTDEACHDERCCGEMRIVRMVQACPDRTPAETADPCAAERADKRAD